jgi:hypothetical protein
MALGAMACGGKWSDVGRHPYLGFGWGKNATARSHGGRLLLHFKEVGGSLLRWDSVQGEGRGDTKGP